MAGIGCGAGGPGGGGGGDGGAHCSGGAGGAGGGAAAGWSQDGGGAAHCSALGGAAGAGACAGAGGAVGSGAAAAGWPSSSGSATGSAVGGAGVGAATVGGSRGAAGAGAPRSRDVSAAATAGCAAGGAAGGAAGWAAGWAAGCAAGAPNERRRQRRRRGCRCLRLGWSFRLGLEVGAAADIDPEVGGEPGQSARPALSDRAELPGAVTAVQLAGDERRLVRGGHWELGDVATGVQVGDDQSQPWHLSERAAVGRCGQGDPLDVDRQSRQVDVDDVVAGWAGLLAGVLHATGRVLGLVVEHEVGVGADLPVGVQQQGRRVHVRHCVAAGPEQGGPYEARGYRQVSTL